MGKRAGRRFQIRRQLAILYRLKRQEHPVPCESHPQENISREKAEVTKTTIETIRNVRSTETQMEESGFLEDS